MSTRTLLLPLGGGVIGQDDVPLVRIMDSDETPTTITVYGVVDTVRPVESVTWTVNGVSQAGDVTKSPVLELTNLQPETSYAITLRATNMNGESQASTRTIWTKKVTTITPSDVLNGITYYDYQDVFQTGTIPSKDENDIVVSGRDVTVPAGYYDENETVSVSSDYIIPTGTKNITDNGNEDVTQYANVNVNVQPALYTTSNVTPTTSQQTISAPTGYYGLDSVTVDGVTSAIDANIQAGNIKDGVTILGVTGTFDPTPNLDTLNVTPSTSSQDISPTGGVDGFNRVMVGPVGASIDQNITSGNIKKDVVILGVTGDYDPTPNLDSLSVNPSTSAQLITPSGNVDGFNMVSVNPVTSAIDQNITAGNIKKDVTILGVTGTFEGGITPTGTLNIVNNGTYDITNYASVNVSVASGNFNELCFTALQANSKVGMENNGTNASVTKPVLYYSTDGRQTWTLWDFSDITLANVDDKVYFYGQNLDGFNRSDNNYSRFTLSGQLSVSGNIMSLITRYGDRDIPNGYCFAYCFYQQGALKDAENLILPSHTTGRCYQNMFSSTGITVTPELKATTLEDGAYFSMFYGCGALTTVKSLDFEYLNGSSNCYCMFQNCGSLVHIPDILKPITLTDYCYRRMFQNCSSLQKTATLPGASLSRMSYDEMFNGCSSLNEVTTYASSLTASNWLNNVAQSGTFYKLKDAVIPVDSPNGVPVGWTVIELSNVVDTNDEIAFDSVAGASVYYTTDGTTPTTSSTLYTQPINPANIGDKFTLKYITVINNTTSPVVEYEYFNMFYIEALENSTVLNVNNWRDNMYFSTDKKSWYMCNTAPSYRITLTNTGDKVYFKKSSIDGSLNAGNVTTVSGTIKTGGCLEYALFWDITDAQVTGKIGNVFQDCTGLIDASKLKLPNDIYGYLPSTSGYHNGLYAQMFAGCTNLIAAPYLQYTRVTVACFSEMFSGCSNLTTAPQLLSESLDKYSYEYMFNNCISLVNVPEIKAKTFANFSFQSMFSGCTSLTSIQLDLTNANGYRGLSNMFNGCTSLSRIVLPDCTSWNSSNASNWLNNVAATGIFVKPASLVIGTGSGQIPSDSVNGIPTGWTTENYVLNSVKITNTSQNSGTFSVYSSDSNFPNYTNLEYSINNGLTWTSLNTVTDTVTVPSGISIFVRGTGNSDFDNEEYTKINFSQSHTVIGDLATLIDYSTASTLTVPQYAYYRLFSSDTTLTSADLTETDFDNGSTDTYKRLFSGCSNLSSVKITTNNWDTTKTEAWLTGVGTYGTIYVNGDSTKLPTNSSNGVPTGWTAVDI